MGTTRTEPLIAAIDGANRVFTVSFSYRPGSIEVWWNGLARRANDEDGWVETDSVAGIITLNETPQSGDRLIVFYRPV